MVAELDQLFFEEYVEHRELCKQIVNDDGKQNVLQVQTTTSKDAKKGEDERADGV